jgi:hypothetical protein
MALTLIISETPHEFEENWNFTLSLLTAVPRLEVMCMNQEHKVPKFLKYRKPSFALLYWAAILHAVEVILGRTRPCEMPNRKGTVPTNHAGILHGPSSNSDERLQCPVQRMCHSGLDFKNWRKKTAHNV